jgi:hypothetical protein
MSTPNPSNYLATNFFKLAFDRGEDTSKIPTVEYFAQSVNLPSLTISPLELPVAQFGVPIRTPVGRYFYENVSISFLVDEEMKNWMEVYEWMRSCGNAEDFAEYAGDPDYSDIFTDGTLLIMDASYNPMKKVVFKDMFPVGISGIQFSSVVVDTEPVIATATFAYTSYEISNAS